jgi:thioredoxin 1
MAEGCVVSLTDEQFEQEVLRDPGTVLVDFYTAACPPCRQVAPILEQLCSENRPTLKVVKVNAAENPLLAGAHKISAVPTLVLYHRGRRISQASGFQSKPQLEKWISASVGAAGQ